MLDLINNIYECKLFILKGKMNQKAKTMIQIIKTNYNHLFSKSFGRITGHVNFQ